MNNLISILLLVASLGIYFGYSRPTYSGVTLSSTLDGRSIAELKEERARYLDALEKTREIEEVRIGLLDTYNRIPNESKEKLEKLLPDHIDSVRLIIDVANRASQYDMTLKNIGLIDSDSDSGQESGSETLGPQEGHTKTVGLKFNVAGSYDNLRAFIKDLEISLRLVDVSDLTFNSGSDGSIDYAFTISTYRLAFKKDANF